MNLDSGDIIYSMTREANELLQKALTLPDRERAGLAGTLISSLEPAVDPDTDAAWQQEIARRREDVRSGRVKSVPRDEVQHKAHSLLHGK